jgi:hypothetical protein
MKSFNADRLSLTLIETIGIFVLTYLMNVSEFYGNLNYLASNQLLKAFTPLP